MPYKRQEYVIQIFGQLKSLLGDDEFKRLFEVILTDNGTEFSDPDSIEFSFKTGKKLISLFYCDPNCSWQKGSIEKNHEYIRYVLPKGTSFSGLSQDDCYTLASNINSVPRVSLNNHSPYEMAINFIGKENMDKYICTVCEYIYDPALGDPENGIAPGTAFEDLPADWVCPLCGVGKEDFEVTH